MDESAGRAVRLFLQDCRQRLLDLLFPPLCHSCREPVADGRNVHICDRCLETVTTLASPLCSCCGRPFPNFNGADHLCGGCLAGKPHFTIARSALLFSGTTRELIHGFKYDGKVILRRPLAILSVGCFHGLSAEFSADLIVPVPLHRKRLRQRGFNQAVLLGEVLSRKSGIPLQRHNLQRIRWTEPQVNLSASARAGNVRGAFALADPARIAGRRILLVDDVYTTGCTVNECSRVLKSAGADGVAVLTVARAPGQGDLPG